MINFGSDYDINRTLDLDLPEVASFKLGLMKFFQKIEKPVDPNEDPAAVPPEEDPTPQKRKAEDNAPNENKATKLGKSAEPQPDKATALPFEEKDLLRANVGDIIGVHIGYNSAGKIAFRTQDTIETNKKIVPKTVLHSVSEPGKIKKEGKDFLWSGYDRSLLDKTKQI